VAEIDADLEGVCVTLAVLLGVVEGLENFDGVIVAEGVLLGVTDGDGVFRGVPDTVGVDDGRAQRKELLPTGSGIVINPAGQVILQLPVLGANHNGLMPCAGNVVSWMLGRRTRDALHEMHSRDDPADTHVRHVLEQF
jgi:hypothetical protein